MYHFIMPMKQADLKSVRDAGFFGVQGKYSDHYPIRIRLAKGRSLKKLSRNTNNSNSESNTCNSKGRIDRKLLTVQEHRDLFISTCKKEYVLQQQRRQPNDKTNQSYAISSQNSVDKYKQTSTWLVRSSQRLHRTSRAGKKLSSD